VFDINFKITTIDYYKDAIYAGESSGYLYRYPLNPNEREIVEVSSNENVKQARLSKSKIQAIKCLGKSINSMVV